MSILTKASQKSRCRGYEYFIDKKVLSCDKISDCEYEGTVQGTMAEPYRVRINLEKPYLQPVIVHLQTVEKFANTWWRFFTLYFPTKHKNIWANIESTKLIPKSIITSDSMMTTMIMTIMMRTVMIVKKIMRNLKMCSEGT